MNDIEGYIVLKAAVYLWVQLFKEKMLGYGIHMLPVQAQVEPDYSNYRFYWLRTVTVNP